MGSDIEYAEGRLEFNSWYSWFYKSKERHIKQHNVNNIKSTYKLTIRILIIGFILFIYFLVILNSQHLHQTYTGIQTYECKKCMESES